MMKKTGMLGVGCLLWAVAAFGQAALPTSYSGPWKTGPLPAGWTQTGLDTDYGTSYDPAGGTPAKLNSAGDLVQINFNSAPSKVAYWVKKNGASADPYSFNVQESVTGATWTDVAVFSNTGTVLPTTETAYTNNLSSASRYVRFIYLVKASGINVGLDGVSITGPGIPSIAFNPSGSQSVPVSNTLVLAVSVTPSGSGISSWSLLSGYAGASSLSGGTFQMTPVAADANKSFTLTVVATNSIGTSTGAVSISVTPYTPPVPVIAFSPAGPYSIMATSTQRLGIGVTPSGSGIQGWTLLPSNYTGSASVAGTNFTFVTLAADGPSNYTLTVYATNSFGTTTGTAAIAVTEYVPAPPPGAYIASFEDGAKTGYASGDVTLSNKVWNLTGILIGTDADDKKIGSKAARLKFDPVDGEETMTVQSKVMSNGVGTISMWYGPYGAHGVDAPTLAIEISASLVSGWVKVGEVAAGSVTELSYYSTDVYVSEPVYVRIRATGGTTGKSANFDNVTITPYTSPASDPYNAFLLQYNVTPGDPGTATNENLDGDAYTNQEEFNAGTNPYDEAIHP